MRCGSTRPTALVTAVLCAFLLAVLAPLPAVSTTVTIGAFYNDWITSVFVCSFYTSGLDTAAKVRSGNGLTYSVTSSFLSSSIAVPQAIGVAQDLQKVADAIFGFAGTFVMGTAMNRLSELNNIMFFGPFAESESNSNPGLPGAVFSQYYSSILWTIPLDGAQSLGLLYYLAQRPSFPRSQLALIQNSNSGLPYYGVGLTAGLLFALEMPKVGVTQYQTAFNGNGYTSAVASKPGVVYMFGQYVSADVNSVFLNRVSLSWMQQMVVDSTLIAANSTVVTTFYIQYAMMEVYQSQLSAGKKMLPAENVMSSAPTPGVDAMEYQVTQDFHSQVTRFPGCINNACKNYVLAGWVGGTALLNAMYMYGGSSAITSSSIYDNLIPAQSSFLVSDLFIGSFGPQATTCSAVAESQGAVCHCNQAGMNIFFTRLTLIGKTVDVVTIPGASFQYAKGKCASVVPPGDNTPVITPYTELVTFSVTKRLVGFRPSDNAMMSEMCSAASAVSSVLSDRLLYRHLAPNGYAVGCIDTKMAAMSSSLASHVSTYVTTSLTGVIPDAVISSIPTPSTFVLDFMPQTTQPRVMQSNLVYLFPTLDQELYVLASYLHGVVTASSVVCGVVSTSSVSPAIVTLVSKSLTTYGMTVASGHMVQTSGVLVSSIPSACTHTFVVGLGGSDAAVVATYLESHPSAVVLLSFDDVTKYYSSLQTSVGGQSSSVTDRVLFATNLPSWTATPSDPTAAASSAPLSTVSQFLQSVPDSLHTPAAVRAFIVAMMYDMLSAGHGPNPDVQQLLYDATTVRMNGVVFGPFSEKCAAMDASSSGTCVGNAGATGIAVWSYTRVVTPETPLRVAASTPSVVYYIPHVSASVAEVRVSDTLDGTVVVPNDGTCVNYSESSSIASGNSSGSFVATVVPTTLGPLSSSRGSVSHPILPFAVDDVLLFLCVAVIVVALTLMILLLWKYNVVYFLVRQVNGCCAGCGDGVTATVTSPAPECDDLRERAMDASRLTATDIESRTVVVVVVEHWRPLWVRAPEVMRRVVAAYQRCVREAVVLHGCVEARSVGGLFVLVCPTASAALLLVGDIHCGLMSMSTRDRDALSSVYRSFGVVDGDDTSDVRVLRIRVGVDTSSGGGACGCLGNGLCSEACVVVATRAAYRRADWAGLCVMTERTRSGLSEDELSSVHLHLVSAGLHALHCGTEDIVLELFVLSPSVSTDVYVAASLVNESSCEHALQMQLSGVETYGGLSSGLCASTLVAFCSGLHTVRVSCLERLLQYFVLPAMSGCAYADEDGYVDALLCAVSVRLGALLECRHGFLPGQLRHCGTGGVSRVRNRECRDEQDGRSSVHGSDPGAERRGAHSTHTPSRTVMLHRVAYSADIAVDVSDVE